MRRSLRILFLGEMMDSGGPGVRIRLATARKMVALGHRVTFVHPAVRGVRPSVRRESDGLVVVETPGIAPARLRRGGFGLLDLLVKAGLALCGHHDVIHTTCGHRPSLLLPSLLGRVTRGAVLVDEWWEWYGPKGRGGRRQGALARLVARYDSALEIPARRLFDGVIAIATPLRDRLPPGSRAVVLNGGAESETLVPHERDHARARLGLDRDVFLVGMVNVARADHDDNVLFLDAFEGLASRYDRLRLWVTGESEYVRTEIQTRPWRDRVVFRGWLDRGDYNLHLSACDLFALPLRRCPRNEGRWPHKVGDYLSVDRPVLTNPTGDLASLFSEYSLGFLCGESSASFQKMLEDVLEGRVPLDVSHRDSLRVAREVLSLDRRVREILDFYYQLLEDRHPQGGPADPSGGTRPPGNP